MYRYERIGGRRFVSDLDTEAVFYPEMLLKLICFVDVYI